MLKPDIMYSATNMEPRRAKQKPSSWGRDRKDGERSRPRRSMSEGVYETRCCELRPSSAFPGVAVRLEGGMVALGG